MQKTIGIVGGGQLGRMLTEPAIKLGYKVIVIDPTPDCPAKQFGAEQIVADYKDGKALKELAQKADYITVEFEHVNTEGLAKLELNKPVNPSAGTIKLIQNKYDQKQFLKQNGYPTAEFVQINNLEQATMVFEEWGKKLMLKSKTDAFDGRGNAFVTDEAQLATSLTKFEGKGVYAEKIVDFQKELAVMVAKDTEGNLLSYPVVETVHARNICVETYCPSGVPEKISQQAQQIAEKAVSSLEGAGVYGVEMFLTHDNQILINEIAPRVHNSGHYTMDMFDVSQFEQHIRAITGQKLAEPKAIAEACCMINILGERDGPVELKGIEKAEKIPGVSVYIYGKSPTKVDRKMGHINATAGTIEEATANAKKARKLISI